MLVSNYVMIPWGKKTSMNVFALFLPRVLVSLKCALKHATEVPVALQKRPTPGAAGGQQSCGSRSRVMASQYRASRDQKHSRGVLEGGKETALMEDLQVPSLHPSLQPVM